MPVRPGDVVQRGQGPAAVLAPPGVPLDAAGVDVVRAQVGADGLAEGAGTGLVGATAYGGELGPLGHVGALGHDRRGERHDLLHRGAGGVGHRLGGLAGTDAHLDVAGAEALIPSGSPTGRCCAGAPRRARRSRASITRVCSWPDSSTSSRRLPSPLRPVNVSLAMDGCAPAGAVGGSMRRRHPVRRAYASAAPRHGCSRGAPTGVECGALAFRCATHGVRHDPRRARPGRHLRLRRHRRAGRRPQEPRPLRRARPRRRHRPRRRLRPRRADRRDAAGRARRLALPDGPGRGRPADLRLPPDHRPPRAGGHPLRRLRARALLRHRRPQGGRLRARPAAGRAARHGHRHRRRDPARRAGRPRAGDLRGRPLRHARAGRRRWSRCSSTGPTCRSAWSRRPASAPASASGCSRSSAAGARRCPRGPPTSEPRQEPSTRRR